MTIKWIKTPHRGLRYYEHSSRKHGKKKDRYYSIRFKVGGKDYTYGIGWWSDGIPEEAMKNDPNMRFEEFALTQLKLYKANVKAGSGIKSPKEKRKVAKEKEAKEQAEQECLEKEAITFGKFFKDTYLPQAKADKKTRTAQREEGLFNLWISPVIGHFPMKDITPFHLEIIKNNMAKKVIKEVEQSSGIKIMKEIKQSPRSIGYALAVIRQVFNTAKRLGVYDGASPTSQVKAPKVDNGRMRFLSRAEATVLLNALKAKSADVHDMTLLSLHCGLRFGEIASLTWQDVDLNKGILTVRDAKAGSRYAFLTEQAVGMLESRPQGKPLDYVFKGRKGKLSRISPTFFRIIDALKFNENIDDPRLQICFHSCRHSYASWLIDQGQDLYTVQKLLGHKTNVMTQRYAHLAENKLKDAAQKLGQALRETTQNSQDNNVISVK